MDNGFGKLTGIISPKTNEAKEKTSHQCTDIVNVPHNQLHFSIDFLLEHGSAQTTTLAHKNVSHSGPGDIIEPQNFSCRQMFKKFDSDAPKEVLSESNALNSHTVTLTGSTKEIENAMKMTSKYSPLHLDKHYALQNFDVSNVQLPYFLGSQSNKISEWSIGKNNDESHMDTDLINNLNYMKNFESGRMSEYLSLGCKFGLHRRF